MKLPKFKDYKNQPVKYIQAKMDGHMHYVIVGQSGVVFCRTKNGKDKTNKVTAISHIWEELSGLPVSTELMAELHCPGVPATSVPTLLNNADERLQLSVFAMPTCGGTDLTDEPLDEVMAKIKSMGLNAVNVSVNPRCYREDLLKLAIDKKIEGWVLKESHMEGWYKLKPVKDIDAFVIDVTESDSATYKGHIKAVRLGVVTGDLDDDGELIIHDLGMCGGFEKDFKLSKPYAEMKRYLMGKVLPIEYREVTPHRKLKWPNVVNDENGLVIRTDKDASQCTVEQLDE
ncbi:hypothetical protein LCGC14_0720010 [marine sediment metagenome]|uniref:ATP-dependent DNA ligase family profile domain-containing protein n=1 Tax=marine sediment metagenome TaxID=412755 RepID=A0A0F9QCQ2_9ZZZZ